MMNRVFTPMAISAMLLFSTSVFATGLATCDSGPEENWKPKSELENQLKEKGWEIRRVKVDGGCYEVYAINENGEKVEAYFHPLTLEPVPLETDKDK